MSATRSRAQRAERQHAQSMVEFSLVAPVLVLMIFLMIDFGRLVYTYGAIAWATREGARLASLQPQVQTDCPILNRVVQVGRGFPLAPDPNSIAGNADPNNPGSSSIKPTTPPPGLGYIYIYPAVAPAAPQLPNNCDGTQLRKTASQYLDVAVQVQYSYVPLIPLISSFVPNIQVRTISVVHTEY